MSQHRPPHPDTDPVKDNLLANRLDRALPPETHFIPPRTEDRLVNTAAVLARTPMPALSKQAHDRIKARMMAAYGETFPATSHANGSGAKSVNGYTSPNGVYSANGTGLHTNGNHLSKTSPAPVFKAPPVKAANTRTRKPRRALEAYSRWAAAAVFVLLLVGLLLSPSVAYSMPGDALYPVKLAIEKIELAAALTPDARVGVHLLHAERRTRESLALLERNRFDPDLIRAVEAEIQSAAAVQGVTGSVIIYQSRVDNVTALLTFVVYDAVQDGLTAPDTPLPGIPDDVFARLPDQANAPQVPPGLATRQARDSALTEETAEATDDDNTNPRATRTPNAPNASNGNNGQSNNSSANSQRGTPTPRPTNIRRATATPNRGSNSNSNSGNAGQNEGGGRGNGRGNSGGEQPDSPGGGQANTSGSPRDNTVAAGGHGGGASPPVESGALNNGSPDQTSPPANPHSQNPNNQAQGNANGSNGGGDHGNSGNGNGGQ